MPPSLPNELFNHIVLQASPSALAVLCRTSKTVLALARPLLYRHVTIRFLDEMSEAYEHASDDDDDDGGASISSADCWPYNADEALCRCLRRYSRLADLVETIHVQWESGLPAPDEMLPRLVKHLLRSCRNAVGFHLPKNDFDRFTYNAERVAFVASDGLADRPKLEVVTLAFSGVASLRFLHFLSALRSLTLNSHWGYAAGVDVSFPSHFPFRLEVFCLRAPDIHADNLFALLKNSVHSLHTLELPTQKSQESSDFSSHLHHFTALTSLTVSIGGFGASATLLVIFHNVGAGSPRLRHLHLYLCLSDFYRDILEELGTPIYLYSELLLQLPTSLHSLRLSLVPVTPALLLELITSGRCPELRSITLERTAGERGSAEEWTAADEMARSAGVVLKHEH